MRSEIRETGNGKRETGNGRRETRSVIRPLSSVIRSPFVVFAVKKQICHPCREDAEAARVVKDSAILSFPRINPGVILMGGLKTSATLMEVGNEKRETGSCLRHPSSVTWPLASTLRPQLSVLCHPSSVLRPLSSGLCHPSFYSTPGRPSGGSGYSLSSKTVSR